MLRYSHPTLALVLDYWPVTIFAPAILVLIATLALITRWWDRRDQEARAGVQSAAPVNGVVVNWQSGRRASSPKPVQPINGNGSARAAS